MRKKKKIEARIFYEIFECIQNICTREMKCTLVLTLAFLFSVFFCCFFFLLFAVANHLNHYSLFTITSHNPYLPPPSFYNKMIAIDQIQHEISEKLFEIWKFIIGSFFFSLSWLKMVFGLWNEVEWSGVEWSPIKQIDSRE